MKRSDLIRHLELHGCRLVREGGSHTIFENLKTKKRTSVPRHSEIVEYTVRKTCNQVDVPTP
ncbi:MAG: type II toxin-antitoxin system HicA family toxin [Acidobacteriota bacterium]